MGALFAILQNDAGLLRCQLRRLAGHALLAEPDRAPAAYGIGYYSASQVLLSKRPTGAPAPLDLAQLTGNVESEALLVHAGRPAVGNFRDEDTQPFRFRRWLFAHDGAVEGFPAVRAALVAQLPEFLRRNIAGGTDSEHLFAWFLKLLRDGGRLDDHDLDAPSAARALAQTVRKIDELARDAGAQRPSCLNLVATNGRILVATRRGRPLHYALYEGILPCELHGLGPGAKDTEPLLVPHRRVKAVCLATLLAQPNGFIEVPEGSALAVSRSLQVNVLPISGA